MGGGPEERFRRTALLPLSSSIRPSHTDCSSHPAPPFSPRALLLHPPLVLCSSILPHPEGGGSEESVTEGGCQRTGGGRQGRGRAAREERLRGRSTVYGLSLSLRASEGGRQGRSASEGERQRLREAASQCRNGLRYVDAPGSDKALTEEEAMTEAMAPR